MTKANIKPSSKPITTCEYCNVPLGQFYCGHEKDNYSCTREKNHEGDHIACVNQEHVIRVWE